MDRRAIGLICVIAGLVAGCAAAGQDTQAPRNPARWAIYIPPGWHVVRFSESAGGARSAGFQISNVRLPAPVQLLRNPAEVNARVLSPDGVGLVISTATGPSPAHIAVAAPPLPLPWPDGSRGWLLGSSPARGPVFEWLWFRTGGTLYVAAATIGWKASKATQQALGRIVRSITAQPGRP